MHVKVNYPDAVMQIREIKCSVKAGDIIGEKLENHIQELDDNITVKESRKSGIERRERILNIQPSSSSDLETRKIAVIARWCIPTMYTERILQKRLQSMLGDGYNLEVNIQQKTVSVTLQLKHYKNRKIIWEMLEGIVPLDQIIDVIIIYNTYRAYKPFTYKELKVKTYDQLRTEVIQ
ncbi:putative phage tail protein [Blautia sp. CLA-JM-H16]|uniref:Phage tail protein n=1 Tax=Blautia aquisgranensis TaxID=3133153 RepID=A0ABV1BLG4_9FIRM